MLPPTTRNKKAFTLLELIVVIVILGILAALAIPTFSSVIEKARERSSLTELQSIGRDVIALKAFTPGSSYTDTAFLDSLMDDVESDIGPLALSAGSYASATEGRIQRNNAGVAPSGPQNMIYYSVVGEGDLVLSTRVSSGKVAAVLIEDDSTRVEGRVGPLGAAGSVISLFDKDSETPGGENPGGEEPGETPAAPILDGPGLINHSVEDFTNFTVSWTPVSGATGYLVSVDSGEPETVAADTLSYPVFVDYNDVKEVHIRAINADGVAGDPTSLTLSAVVAAPEWTHPESKAMYPNGLYINSVKLVPGFADYVLLIDGVEVARSNRPFDEQPWNVRNLTTTYEVGSTPDVSIAVVAPNGTFGTFATKKILVEPR